MKRALLIILGVIVLLAVIGSLGSDRAVSDQPASYQPPENFANINGWASTETDCTNLQTWFDGAYNMHGRVSGDLAAMQWYTALMDRLDSRMETVGCYG